MRARRIAFLLTLCIAVTLSKSFGQASVIPGTVATSPTSYSVPQAFNRLMVVSVSAEWGGVQTGQLSSVLYKGQNLTQAIARSTAAGQNRTEMWYLNDAGLRNVESCVAGNFTLNWSTSSGNVVPATVAFSVMVLQNVDQSTIIPAGTSTTSGLTASGTTVTLPTVNTGSTNDIVIYASSSNESRTHTPPGGGTAFTELSDQTVGATLSHAIATRQLAGPATLSPVATWEVGNSSMIITGMVVNGVASIASTQRTFYSLADGDWDNSNTWSLTSDGSSGAVTAGLWPGRNDHVVIRATHDITINSREDNRACGTTAEALGITGGFSGSGVNSFYHSGNISVNGSLNSSVDMILGGATSFASGSTMDFSSFLIQLGTLDAASGMTLFRTMDDLVLAGNSATVINTSSVSSDDLILSGTAATLCGTGVQTLTNGAGSQLTLHNGAQMSQICSAFTVTCTGGGCSGSFPLSGTGSTIPGNTGPGGVGGSSVNRLWLKSSDLTQANNTSVTSWADASGNGLTAVANSNPSTNVNNQPRFFTNIVNGLPSIVFDGSDYLTLGTPAALNLLPQTDPMVFYSVVNAPTASTSVGTILSKAYNDPSDNRQYQFQLDVVGGTDNRLTVWAGNSFSAATSGTPTGGWKVNSTFVPAAASGVRSWIDETETSYGATAIGTGTSSVDVLVGARRATTATNSAGFLLNASLAEIILYRASFGEIHRTIVANYLAAKYNTTLPGGLDLYTMDNAGNGNYDFDVAGIGWDGDDNSSHLDSKGSGIVRMWGPNAIAANEYLFWGHDGSPLLSSTTSDVDGAIIRERLTRVWRVSETGDVGTVNISFDLSAIAGTSTFVGSNLRLLIDTDNAASPSFADNDIAPITGIYSGNTLTFTGVDLANGYRFTIGNTDASNPLPIELVHFEAVADRGMVMLSWATESEINNDFFTVERSRDGFSWSSVLTLKGAGTSAVRNEYKAADEKPFAATSYYRLKQTDFDKKFTYSRVVKVDVNTGPEITAMPNPSRGRFALVSNSLIEPEHVRLLDLMGRDVPFTLFENDGHLELDAGAAPAGIYIIRISNGTWTRSVRVVRQ